MKHSYAALALKYKSGFDNFDLSDLDGAEHSDVLKFRADVTGTDVIFANATLRGAHGKGEKDKKDKKKRSDPPRYTMSTENPVGMFGDVVLVRGWDLGEFRRRGQPFLFAHNQDEQRHPLGNMANVLKGATSDFVRKEPVLAGDGVFTPVGLNPFNDLTRGMVDSGAMPGGSVGFRATETRAPTEKELEGDKRLRKWSAIITKARLTEFSAVPVGMDPDALKRRSDYAVHNLEEELLRAIESGKYDEDLVAEWRHAFLGVQTEAERGTVTVVVGAVGADSVDEAVSNNIDPVDDAIRGALGIEGDDEHGGADDSNDAERVSDSGNHESAPSSTPGLSMEDTLRGLHALGVDTTEEELREAVTRVVEPVSNDDLRAENEALRTMASEQGTDIEDLKERVAFLEASLLPESASDDGGDGVSRSEGDDGTPEVDDDDTEDVYALIDALDEAELADLVNA